MYMTGFMSGIKSLKEKASVQREKIINTSKKNNLPSIFNTMIN